MATPGARDHPNATRQTSWRASIGDDGWSRFATANTLAQPPPTTLGLHHSKFRFQTPADIHTDIAKKLDPLRNTDKSPLQSLLLLPSSGLSGGTCLDLCSTSTVTPWLLGQSPQVAISERRHADASTSLGTCSRVLLGVQEVHNGMSPGYYMCECCPRKPSKFETEEELNAHVAKKRYGCAACSSRFNNKNEAERHRISFHVRQHLWSCSFLTGYHRAFHPSTNRPGGADTCGYCGNEFLRSGHPVGSVNLSGSFQSRQVTEHDWEERIYHLQNVHRFRECNLTKRFYRADHFRQHLKHSHAGTNGKWMAMLENACSTRV